MLIQSELQTPFQVFFSNVKQVSAAFLTNLRNAWLLGFFALKPPAEMFKTMERYLWNKTSVNQKGFK